MTRWLAPRTLGLVAAAVLAGCTSTPSATPSALPDAGPPPGATTLSALQTAADMAKPWTATLGVWSVVGHLHLSVYGPGPTTLLAGSDRPTSEGVYLYGGEIPLLAVMAGEATEPLSHFAKRIATAQGSTETDISQALAGATANPFVAAYLQARQIDLRSDPQVTQFDEWVVYFAAFDPRTGVPAARLIPIDPAPTVTQASTRLDSTNPPTKQDFINAIHTMILYAALLVELNPVQASLQMGASQFGESVTLTATAQWKPMKKYGFGWLNTHGCHFVWPAGQPLRDFFIDLTFPAGSKPYFTVSSAHLLTGNDGAASFQVIALEDPGHGVGTERVAALSVEAIPSDTSADIVLTPSCNHVLQREPRAMIGITIGKLALQIHYHDPPSYDAKIVLDCPDPGGYRLVQTYTGKFIPVPNALGTWLGKLPYVTTVNGQTLPGAAPAYLGMSSTTGPNPMLLVAAPGVSSPVKVPIGGGTGTDAAVATCPVANGTVTVTLTLIKP